MCTIHSLEGKGSALHNTRSTNSIRDERLRIEGATIMSGAAAEEVRWVHTRRRSFCPPPFTIHSSTQEGRPAEFKHIIKQRKRKQP